jgi:sorting nexin-29
MSTTKAKVKIGNNLGKECEFNKGAKQRDGLSTTLFILALHKAARKIDQQGKIYNKSSQICAYADDIAIIARTKRKLIEVYEELEEEPEQMGLIANCKKKIKYMIVPALEPKQKLEDLHIGEKIFEGVSNFKYLGNVIDNENKIIICVMEEIQAGNKAYYANLHSFKIKLISRN